MPVIGQVDKILFHSNLILILDQTGNQLIYCFDTSGRFRGFVGTKGFGPDEFEFPEDVAINDEYIVVCTSGKYLLWFNTSDLKFVKKTSIPVFANSIAAIDGGRWLISTNHYVNNPYKTHVLELDGEGNLVSGHIPIVNKNYELHSANGFYRGPNGQIYFTPTRDSILYLWNDVEFIPVFSLLANGDAQKVMKSANATFMNAPLIGTSTHLLFYSISSQSGRDSSAPSVQPNILDYRKKEWTKFDRYTIDFMLYGIEDLPITTFQDSVLVWIMYPDGIEACQELYGDILKDKDVNQLGFKDRIAQQIISTNKLSDNPTLLLGRWK
jgi:hypothetical protein